MVSILTLTKTDMFRVIYLDEDPEYRREAGVYLASRSAATDFVIAHTSGSTGKPKEIRLPKRDIVRSAQATVRRFNLTDKSRMLCPLSTGYIAGKMMIERAVEADCEIALCKPSNRFWADPAVAGYISSGVSLLAIVPSQIQTLLSYPDARQILSRIENIIIGGAPLDTRCEQRLIELTADLHTKIFATYGMTETCSHIALRKIGRKYFMAMPGVTFLTDKRGCLNIIAPEYSFGSLQTNDMVSLSNDSSFIWRGRYDNVINTGGIKLFPEEIERKLAYILTIPYYIKGEPDPLWGRVVTLVIEGDADSKPTDDELMSMCREVLTAVEMPKRIIRRGAFDLTSSGKLIRR